LAAPPFGAVAARVERPYATEEGALDRGPSTPRPPGSQNRRAGKSWGGQLRSGWHHSVPIRLANRRAGKSEAGSYAQDDTIPFPSGWQIREPGKARRAATLRMTPWF